MRKRSAAVGLFLLVLTLLGNPAPARAQAPSRYTIYLVTMYPGEALFTGFGHIAFRVVDSIDGTDNVFDYGTYEADDPYLAPKFLVGGLKYYCSTTTYEDMLAWYSAEFGGILLQKLNVTATQAERLVARVTTDCLPENAAYSYHHFTNNCATKLRDILDDLVDGELGLATKGIPAGRSLRDLIDASLAPWPFAVTRWIVFGLLNWEMDRPADRWQQMFLPWYLSREVDGLRQPALPGRPPLVSERKLALGSERPEPSPPTSAFGIVVLLLLGALGLAPLALSRATRRGARLAAGVLLAAAGLLTGLYGCILVFSWALAPYPETFATLTLLCFHPLHFFLVPAGLGTARRGGERWRRRALVYLLIGIGVLALVLVLEAAGVIPQRLWHYGLAGLAFNSTLAFSLWSGLAHEE